jgi:heme exporter protein C
VRLFRSNLFLWFLGLALAVQVYIAFETPIAGSFGDVTMLQMNGTVDPIPVKVHLVRPVFDSAGAKYAAMQDLYDEPGLVRLQSATMDAPITMGSQIVMEVMYNASAKSFDETELVRVNPAMTFPMIQGLGELGRNMLFHVPMAMVAFIAFLFGTIYSIQYLRKKDFDYDRRARAASAAGFVFTILATVTGSIWARFSWGTFWNWDPRETSIFILLLIYAAYFLLRSLLEEGEDKKARIAAVYNIIAFISVPFLMFVVPRITQSLHPGGGGVEAPILNLSGKVHTDRTLLDMHWISVLLFFFVFLWMKDLYTRILRVEDLHAEAD